MKGGGGGGPSHGAGFSGFGDGASAFPGGTFHFSSSGARPSGMGGFQASDPMDIFEMLFGGKGGGGMGSGFGTPMDEDFGSFGSSFGGMPGGMGGSSGGRTRGKSQSNHSKDEGPSEWTKPVQIPLEDLFNGVNKKLKINRKTLRGRTEERILEFQVKPGWKSGTKVRFQNSGNEINVDKFQDVVFIIEEKPHSTLVFLFLFN